MLSINALNERLLEGDLREEEWGWLTEEQIQYAHWRTLFQRVPLHHIPLLIQKICHMEGEVGVMTWRLHLLYEFIDAQREEGLQEKSKMRLVRGLSHCPLEYVEELRPLLTSEEIRGLGPLFQSYHGRSAGS